MLAPGEQDDGQHNAQIQYPGHPWRIPAAEKQHTRQRKVHQGHHGYPMLAQSEFFGGLQHGIPGNLACSGRYVNHFTLSRTFGGTRVFKMMSMRMQA